MSYTGDVLSPLGRELTASEPVLWSGQPKQGVSLADMTLSEASDGEGSIYFGASNLPAAFDPSRDGQE
jgi:hypothetical protein